METIGIIKQIEPILVAKMGIKQKLNNTANFCLWFKGGYRLYFDGPSLVLLLVDVRVKGSGFDSYIYMRPWIPIP